MVSAGISDEELEAVMAFVDFATNMENQEEIISTLSRLPALKEALESNLIANDPILKGSAAQMAKGAPMPVVMEMRCNWDAMKPELRFQACSQARSLGTREKDIPSLNVLEVL